MKTSYVCFTLSFYASSAVLEHSDFFSGIDFCDIFLPAPKEFPCILFCIHKVYSLDYDGLECRRKGR